MPGKRDEPSDDDETAAERATLEKIAAHAAAKGLLAEREARSAAGQAMLHHGDRRAFLRKLIERKAGLTTDEAKRVETEALAPPPPPPSQKPLPNLKAPKGDSAPAERVIVDKRALPRLFGPKKPKDEAPG